LYFAADDGYHGFELWRTDGTAAGTALVQDIGRGADPSQNGSRPQSFTILGNTLYFLVALPNYECQLWKSDGSAAGTVKVKGELGSYPNFMRRVGDKLIFATQTGSSKFLWASDGTDAGTTELQTFLSVDIPSSHQANATDNELFFYAQASGGAAGLWRTNGTAIGTSLLLPGVRRVTVVGSDMFYVTNTNSYQYDLWKLPINGGPATLLKSMSSISGYRGGPLAVGGKLLFVAPNANGRYSQLWTSDGTVAGAKLAKDFGDDATAPNLEALAGVQGKAYFGVRNDDGYSLWVSDPTGSIVDPVIPLDFVTRIETTFVTGGALYFVAADGQRYWQGSSETQYGLWKTNGTASGTARVTTLAYGVTPPDLSLATLGDKIIFNKPLETSTAGNVNVELWMSDSTADSAVLLKDINGANGHSNAFGFVSSQGGLYFAISADRGDELWRYDATGQATRVKDFLGSYPRARIGVLKPSGAYLYFTVASDETRLYRTDGTPGGTIYLAAVQTPMAALVEYAGAIYFVGGGIQGSGEIWRTDGTVAGTLQLTNLQGDIDPPSLAIVKDRLMFTRGGEIWKSDGTPEGTVLVRNVGLGAGEHLYHHTSTGNLLYASNHSYMWRSDGTFDGTFVIADSPHDTGRDIAYPAFAMVGDTVFFRANDGVHGYELWKSNGTVAGTGMVKDLSPGESGSMPFFLAPAGNRLLFSILSASGQTTLWLSDGTNDGTQLLMNTTTEPSAGTAFVGGVTYFVAGDANFGSELWATDGTVAGTRRVSDLRPGPDGVFIRRLYAVDGNVIFTADNGVYGNEPWILQSGPSTRAGDYDRNGQVDGGDFILWQRRLGAKGAAGDSNNDGLVNADDFAAWRSAVGRFPSTAGDFDGDFDADGTDFLAWQRGLGLTPTIGDGNHDGIVNDADLRIVLANFGKTYEGGVAAPSSVLAPATWDAASEVLSTAPSVDRRAALSSFVELAGPARSSTHRFAEREAWRRLPSGQTPPWSSPFYSSVRNVPAQVSAVTPTPRRSVAISRPLSDIDWAFGDWGSNLSNAVS
jgi:ELWxxDGT repeat protein